jgi:transposase
MTLPTTTELEACTRAELLALVTVLCEQVRQLQAAVARLTQPPPTSRNSSQPPSRDQKQNLRETPHPKKFGPPFGHERHVRPLVEQPDQVLVAPVVQCQSCQADLQRVAPTQVLRRQLTELPIVAPVVIETQQHEVICPHCQTRQRGVLPPGLEAERQFGPRLEATVVYLKQTQHLSYQRVVQALHEMAGVALSEGGVNAILARAGVAAAAAATTLKEEIKASAVVHSDETSARVAGQTWWQWVVGSAAGVYHQLAPSRGADVLADIMGEATVEVWVSDCFSAQLKAPAQVFQLCLAHQLRDLQRVLDAEPKHAWAKSVQALFQSAIHLHHQFDDAQPTLSLDEFVAQTAQLDDELDELLTQEITGARALNLQARFLKHRDKLLTFLHYPGVPPTNNVSERALRPSVIHRKVTNGFRSEWGAQGYAALQTVIATAQLKGEQVFATLVNLMGAPVLHFLSPSDP